MNKHVTVLILSVFSSGCAITRAESNYELNRRAGMPLPNEKEVSFNGSELRSSSTLKKSSYMPARVPPIVERVWFFDRKIGNYWQQGTWVWVEVEAGKWLSDLDPGGAPLILSSPPTAQTRPGQPNSKK